MIEWEQTFPPNALGHNLLSIGELVPGVDNLVEVFLNYWNAETQTAGDAKDLTGFSAAECVISSSTPERDNYTTIVSVPVEIIVPASGKVRFNVSERHIRFFIIPAGLRRGRFILRAKNPEGILVEIGRGTWFLGRAAQ